MTGATRGGVLANAAVCYDFIYNKYLSSLSLSNFASRTASSLTAIVKTSNCGDTS